MAITVTGVPQSITSVELTDWLASIGIDAGQCLSLRVDRGGITAEVYALDEEGHRYGIGSEDDLRPAIDTVVIPIVDEG